MKALLGIALVAALAGVYMMNSTSSQLTDDSVSRMFEDFIMENRRSYASVDEYSFRLGVFKKNLEIAAQIQAEQDEAVFGVTIFSDWTQEEFKKVLSFNEPAGRRPVKHTEVKNLRKDYSDNDWRPQYDRVKDQGSCGSCWSFSASASAEPRAKIAGHNDNDLAEQQCVDCDPESEGCNGGWMSTCFAHLTNRPLCSESEYPYTASDTPCTEGKCAGKSWEISGHVDLAEGDCDGLDEADNSGPVSVAVDATAMQFYSSGIIKPGMFCGDTFNSLNHGIAVYGEAINGQSTAYWIAKNSWGGRWGEKGYAKFKIGNTCGICLASSYPLIKSTR